MTARHDSSCGFIPIPGPQHKRRDPASEQAEAEERQEPRAPVAVRHTTVPIQAAEVPTDQIQIAAHTRSFLRPTTFTPVGFQPMGRRRSRSQVEKRCAHPYRNFARNASIPYRQLRALTVEHQRALAFSPRRVDVDNGALRSVRGSQERAQLICADVIGCRLNEFNRAWSWFRGIRVLAGSWPVGCVGAG